MNRSILSIGVALCATLSLTACTDEAPTAAAAEDHAAHLGINARNGAEIGQTLGWYDGKNITFHYNKPFFCAEPTASQANSKCILGEEPAAKPRSGEIPVLYVTVPLFAPSEAYSAEFAGTLQCPELGKCINHPGTIDLSAIQGILVSLFGETTGGLAPNFPLPPHSHVIGDEGSLAKAGWWEIEVVGVPSEAAWKRLAMGKNLETVRELQAEGAVTGDIPTNLFLFFSVNPSGK
jgi:hypothetical protein